MAKIKAKELLQILQKLEKIKDSIYLADIKAIDPKFIDIGIEVSGLLDKDIEIADEFLREAEHIILSMSPTE